MILHVLESEETSVAYEQQEQVRIVQETVAGKEITFAHVMGGPAPVIYKEKFNESASQLQRLCYRRYEYDTAGIGRNCVRHCCKKRRYLFGVCGPFYRYFDYYWRNCRRYHCADGDCELFPG